MAVSLRGSWGGDGVQKGLPVSKAQQAKRQGRAATRISFSSQPMAKTMPLAWGTMRTKRKEPPDQITWENQQQEKKHTQKR